MTVDMVTKNAALESLFIDPQQVITLDANFLIPPDRSIHLIPAVSFPQFKTIWLDPIFELFPKLAIHEAVRDELVSRDIKAFIQNKVNAMPSEIIIHKDSELTAVEHMLRDSIEARIYPHTRYDPQIDNRDDRGEVKTLAYIAVKGLLYFAAHDYNAIQLVEKAESWSTGLDTIQAIKMYEIIFFLYAKKNQYEKVLKDALQVSVLLDEKREINESRMGCFHQVDGVLV